ncbi:MAG: MFS transporter [Oscillatoriales cyanobacterium C42_A2020_001]|nr:MFS transporter [Leptolyngbyaceae cyanobacterium C42_A2020_001]
MRTFTIIWSGQFVSTVGSYMTEFALILWAWQVTGSATALALVAFFSRLLRIPLTLIAGLIVDRYNRKTLMMIANAISMLCTSAIAVLYFTHQLQIWHLYLTAAIQGGASQIQGLAYQTSLTLLVPSQDYLRANSMNSSVHYGSTIFAPALAGVLFPWIGLSGILVIDWFTFGLAIATLLSVHIPQPEQQNLVALNAPIQNLRFSLAQVWKQPSLRLLLGLTTVFWFVHDLGEAIYDPMILARTNGSAQVLASTAIAAGIGGVTGAIAFSVWGGFPSRIRSLLSSFMGAGFSKTIFGFGQSPGVWIPAQFCSSLNFPLMDSSETAIWMEKIAPAIQGRIFAANAFVMQLTSAIATLIAGPLAERVFEPLFLPGAPLSKVVGAVMGDRASAGLSFLYILCAMTMVLVGIVGFNLPKLRTIEETSMIGK